MDTPSQQNLNQLPLGSPLGDFTITGIVGEGGFGIVYLAYEAALDRVVAIKEYLPSSIAGRTGNQSVMVRSQVNSNAFAAGLKNFLREAQMLAKFSHPALVEVHRVWEQNATAYMAMRYYEGKTLREWRLNNEDFDEHRIRRLLEPVFDALSLLHAQNVIHRDVSPDNILMRGSGTPVLLDLGAARLVIGGMTQALTTILKPGYAPIEQYVDDGTMHQGPWTDVYGLGAVLYYMLTGVAPPQAVARMITDPLHNMASKVRVAVPEAFIDAVIKALAVRPENRFQSVDDLRDGLGWTEPLPAEPRTQYTRAGGVTRGVPAASGGNKPVTVSPAPATSPALPTAVVSTPIAATALAAPSLPIIAIPAPAVVIASASSSVPTSPVPVAPAITAAVKDDDVDDNKTVIWNSAAASEAVRAARLTTAADTFPSTAARAVAAPTSPAIAPEPPQAAQPAPAAATAAPAVAAVQPATPPRVKIYGDAPSSGSKTWLFVALAAAVAAVGGYFAFNRTPSTASAPVTPTLPPALSTAATAPDIVAKPSVAVPPPAAAPARVPAPASANAPPVATKPAPATAPPVIVAQPPAFNAADAKAKEAARTADDEAIAKTKREAVEKAKVDAQEKTAKAKADADERARKLRVEAEERAATARAEQEEKARRAREEEDLVASAKAKQEAADRQKAASLPAPGGMVVTPPRRSVEELASSGNAAFKRGEMAAARTAWNELVAHPEATARSKAIAYYNLAASYCTNSDEANCERMLVSMLRADRAYGAEIPERELPQFKRAYERAARQVRVPGY